MITIDTNSFGKFLRSSRKGQGLTLVELSKQSGVSQPHLSHIENGKRRVPSPEILRRLAKPLGVEYTEMLQEAGYVEDEAMLELISNAKKEKVYKLKNTESTFMVDLSNLGEGQDDLEEFLKATLGIGDSLFFGNTELTPSELSLIIDFIELLIKHRKDDNN